MDELTGYMRRRKREKEDYFQERYQQMDILIAGTGGIADEFERYITNSVTVIGYVETKPTQRTKNNKIIYTYEEICTIEYDRIVVANIYSDEIKTIAKENNLELNKFIFLRPWADIDYELGSILFHWNELEYIAPNYITEKLDCNKRYFIANRMWLDDISDTVLDKYSVQKRDYFRYRTFEMVADQIKDLNGAVAEVGVFQGEFAQIINAKFSDKKLYLFDTFESFSPEEFEIEKSKGNCADGFDKVFTYTNEEKVLNRMPYPEKCIIKKGLFPTSVLSGG